VFADRDIHLNRSHRRHRLFVHHLLRKSVTILFFRQLFKSNRVNEYLYIVSSDIANYSFPFVSLFQIPLHCFSNTIAHVMTVYENRIGDRVSVANHFHHRDSSISNVVDKKGHSILF